MSLLYQLAKYFITMEPHV